MTNLSPSEVRTIVLGAMMALFLSALDQTIVATAIPSIGADLGDFQLVSWIVTAYLLTSTCATPILGKLSDIYGRRTIMRLCLAVFVIGSVACALSSSMVALIVARAVQGLGGGGLITMAQTIVADVVAPRERGRYGAYFSSVWAGSALLGPTLGGFLTEYASWHWIFWINLPLGLVTLLTMDRLLRRLELQRRVVKIDYASIVVFSLGSTALLLALSWGGTTYPWASPQILVAALVAIVFGTVFAVRQRRLAEPIIPPRFVTDPVVGPILLSIFLVFGAYLAIAVLAPIFLQVALNRPASEVGLLMIPLMLSTTLTAFVSGRYISRTGTYKRPPMVGLPIAIVTLLLLAYLAMTGTSALVIAILLLIVGLGIGPIFPVANVAAQNAVARTDLGAISGSISFARALGGAIATAGASTLVLSLISRWLPASEHFSGLQDLVRRPLTEVERIDVSTAFGVLFASVAGALALGLLAFSRMEHRPLRGKAEIVTESEAA